MSPLELVGPNVDLVRWLTPYSAGRWSLWHAWLGGSTLCGREPWAKREERYGELGAAGTCRRCVEMYDLRHGAGGDQR